MPVRVPVSRALIALLTTAAALALPAGSLAADWSAPVRVSGETVDADNAVVKLGPDGSVTAFWGETGFDADYPTARALVSATRLPASDTWSTPTSLTPVAAAATSYPAQAAAASDGTVTVVWEQAVQSGNDIYSATREAGSATWSPATRISDADATGSSPVIAVRPDDSFVVLWQTFYGADTISATVQRADGSWTGVTRVVESGDDTFEVPTLTVDDEGTTTALFTRRIDGTSVATITAKRLPSGSEDSWGAEEVVEALSVGSYEIGAGTTPNGDVTAAYQVDATGGDGPDLLHVATRSSATGIWTSEPLVTTPTVFVARVASDSAGNVTIAWMDVNNPEAGVPYAVSAQTRLAGQAWSDTAPHIISTPGLMSAYPSLFYTGNDSITALWVMTPDFQSFGMQSAASGSPGTFGAPATFGGAVDVNKAPSNYDGNRYGALAAAWADGVTGAVYVSDVAGDYTADPDPTPPPVADTPAPPTEPAPPATAPPVVLAPKLTPEARLTGKKLKLSAVVKTKRCSGRVRVVVSVGKTRYRVTLPLRNTKRAGKKVCVVSGTVGLPKAPATSVKPRVTVSGKAIKTRVLTATR